MVQTSWSMRWLVVGGWWLVGLWEGGVGLAWLLVFLCEDCLFGSLSVAYLLFDSCS